MNEPRIQIDKSQCKGCQLCVSSCPKTCIEIADSFNAMGYKPAQYKGHDCTGCAICYYMCPEPGAISVYKK